MISILRYSIFCILLVLYVDQASTWLTRSYVRRLSRSHFNPSSISTPARVLSLASSSLNDQTNDFKTVFILPRVDIPVQSGIGFVQEWAVEAINSLGAGMKATKHPQGIVVTFKPSPGSHFDIFVFDDRSQYPEQPIDKIYDLTIKARLVIKDGSTRQVASLLSMSAENILESLTTHIQTEMISPPTPTAPTPTAKEPESKLIESPPKSSHILAESVIAPSAAQAVSKQEVSPVKPSAASVEPAIDPIKQRILKMKEEIPALRNYQIVEIDEDSPEYAKLAKNSTTIDMEQLKRFSTPPSQEELDKMWVKIPENETMEEFEAMESKRRTKRPTPTSTKVIETQLVSEPIKPNASSSPSAVAVAVAEVKEEGMDPNPGREIYAWSRFIDPKQRSVVVSCLQNWAYNYTARGIGMDTTNTADGVNISFPIGASASLSVFLSDRNSKTVLLSRLVAVDADERDRALIEGVTKKLEASAQKFVSELDVRLIDEDMLVAQGSRTASAASESASNMTQPHRLRSQINQRLDGFRDDDEFLGYLEEVTSNPSSSELPSSSQLLNDYVQPIASSAAESTISSPQAATQRVPSMQQQQQATSRKRDPAVMAKAAELGMKIENFENRGLEEQAIQELNNMIRNSQEQGFLQVIRSYRNDTKQSDADATIAPAEEKPDLDALMAEGLTRSRENWQKMLNRTGYMEFEDLSRPIPTIPIDLKAGGLNGDFDLFSGPPLEGQGSGSSTQDPAAARIEGVSSSTLPASDPSTIDLDIQRLSLLVNELQRAPADMHEEIIDSYRDLLLSSNMVYLLLQANRTESSIDNRQLYSKISQHAAKPSLELVSMINQESMRHLQTIYDVCEIAQKYQHRDLLFLEHLDYVKPRFDTAFLAYLNFAIEGEKRSQRLKGFDVTRYPSKWLLILTVIRQGVQAEFEQRYERILEPLLLVVRFEQKFIREDLFRRFVNKTAAIDLQYMRTLALNMVDNIRANMHQNANFVEKDVFDRLLELEGYVQRYLSEEYIQEKMEEFEETARKQGMEIVIAHRNPIVRQEMVLQDDLENVRSRDDRVGVSILDRPASRQAEQLD